MIRALALHLRAAEACAMAKKSAAKRELINTGTDKRYERRRRDREIEGTADAQSARRGVVAAAVSLKRGWDGSLDTTNRI